MQQHLRTIGIMLMAAAVTFGIARAHADEYLQRTDTITMSAGNAPEVNSAIHTIDPWPPYVNNRRIPGNGARMTGAIQRYRQPPQAAPSAPAPGVGLTPVPAYSPGSASVNPATSSSIMSPQ
jgi:hypothetical protein